MNEKRMKATRIAIAALLGFGALSAVSAIPAHAETELQALKRQVAEQQALINKLLAAQANQKAAIERIETRAAQAPAPSLVEATAKTPAQAAKSILPQGLSWYATLDVNVANTNSGYGRKFSVGSNGMTASSIGLKADKEVTNGLHAIGELEMGVDISTGVVGSDNSPGAAGVNNYSMSSSTLNGKGSQIFSRQAYAGMGSDMFGKLTLGRQYTGSYIGAAIEGSAFGPGFYGASGLLLPLIGGMPTRVNNSIVYKTPDFEGYLKGLSVWATYFAGSENNTNDPTTPTLANTGNTVGTHDVTDSSGEGYDLALFYRGPVESPLKGLTAAVTAWSVTNPYYVAQIVGQGQHQGWQAVASYDFDVVKVYGNYVSGWYNGSGKGGTGTTGVALADADGWSVSAKVPFLRDHAIIGSYARINDKSTGVTDADTQLVGVAYTYKLFKASTLYVNWGKAFNGKHASYPLNDGGDLSGSVNPENGYNPDGIMVGVNTKF
ncbi:MAG: porin [Desulfobulbaceae bacterium]|jgi:predicted porin|nr:porin [Desulfobulbaceae bacterium]